MKLASSLLLGSLTMVGMGVGLGSQSAIASQFAQAEVDQSRFVALASPFAGGSAHRLVILEQISNARACWQDNGSSVTPLLLNFDFTGICGRNPDSNGYSVRVAGQDLGTQYMLRIRPRGNALVLYADPVNARAGRSLEVGRSTSRGNGFSRIDLNPGWRFAKRVYNGQQLGHIYLTNDQSLSTLVATAGGSSGVWNSNNNSNTGNSSDSWNNNTSGSTSGNTSGTNGSSWGNGSWSNNSWGNTNGNTNNNANNNSNNSGSWNNSGTWNTGPRNNSSGNSLGNSSGNTGGGRPTAGAIEIPVIPASDNVAVAPDGGNTGTRPRGTGSLLPVPTLPPTPQGQRPPGDNSLPAVAVNRPPAPGTEVSWSSSGGGPTAPGNTAAQMGLRYRVIVQATTPDAQAQVRAIAPDAFRTIINGQTVMQAGVFRDAGAAQSLQQTLSSQNLSARVIPVQ